MATNGFSRAGRSGRTPHFLTVGLLVVICILAFNYWNVSSQNKMLQKEREEMTRNLEELALRRVHLEKRSEALDNQLRENNQNIQVLTNDKNSCLTSLKETGDERDDLRTKFTEKDEELKRVEKELEESNQQLDEKYAQVLKAQQEHSKLEAEMYAKENELQQYQDRNTELQQTIQTLSIEKEQCYDAYKLLESKQQQTLQLKQANLPAAPPQNKLTPDQQQLQQQQQQLIQNDIPSGQAGDQINVGQQVPGNFQVPGVPNVPVFMNQGVPPAKSGMQNAYGRGPQIPDMKLNLPVPGDNNIPGHLDNVEESKGEDAVKIAGKSEIGEDKNIEQQDGQLKESDNNGESKPMVHVDPGMINQVEGGDEEEMGDNSAQQALDRKEPDDMDKENGPSADLKDQKQISENAVDGGLSNMDSASDDDQEDPDKAIDDNGGPSADDDQFDSEKENGGLQIDRAKIVNPLDEQQDDMKLRFERHDIQNQLNPGPNDM